MANQFAAQLDAALVALREQLQRPPLERKPGLRALGWSRHVILSEAKNPGAAWCRDPSLRSG